MQGVLLKFTGNSRSDENIFIKSLVDNYFEYDTSFRKSIDDILSKYLIENSLFLAIIPEFSDLLNKITEINLCLNEILQIKKISEYIFKIKEKFTQDFEKTNTYFNALRLRHSNHIELNIKYCEITINYKITKIETIKLITKQLEKLIEKEDLGTICLQYINIFELGIHLLVADKIEKKCLTDFIQKNYLFYFDSSYPCFKILNKFGYASLFFKCVNEKFTLIEKKLRDGVVKNSITSSVSSNHNTNQNTHDIYARLILESQILAEKRKILEEMAKKLPK